MKFTFMALLTFIYFFCINPKVIAQNEDKKGIVVSNEEKEDKVISQMISSLHELMQSSFDYSIQQPGVQRIDTVIYGVRVNNVLLNDKKHISIHTLGILVTATANNMMDSCAIYIDKQLSSICVSDQEFQSSENAGKLFYRVRINYNGLSKTFRLRNKNSITLLKLFTSHWQFYTRLFTIEFDNHRFNGIGDAVIYDFSDNTRKTDFNIMKDYNAHYYSYSLKAVFEYEKKSTLPANYVDLTINYLKAGQEAAKFEAGIEERAAGPKNKITLYKVKPRGLISQFSQGHFVVNTFEYGHELIVASSDLEIGYWWYTFIRNKLAK